MESTEPDETDQNKEGSPNLSISSFFGSGWAMIPTLKPFSISQCPMIAEPLYAESIYVSPDTSITSSESHPRLFISSLVAGMNTVTSEGVS